MTIRRQHHVHGTDRTLHRMIAFVERYKCPISECRCKYNTGLIMAMNAKIKSESFCRTHP